MVARILIWDLADSETTLEELRPLLPRLHEGDRWITNEAQERLGLISFADDPPDLSALVGLIGGAPAVAEEFDVE